jgi:hypothetical protein
MKIIPHWFWSMILAFVWASSVIVSQVLQARSIDTTFSLQATTTTTTLDCNHVVNIVSYTLIWGTARAVGQTGLIACACKSKSYVSVNPCRIEAISTGSTIINTIPAGE